MTDQDVKLLICELFLDGDTSFELDADANLLEALLGAQNAGGLLPIHVGPVPAH